MTLDAAKNEAMKQAIDPLFPSLTFQEIIIVQIWKDSEDPENCYYVVPAGTELLPPESQYHCQITHTVYLLPVVHELVILHKIPLEV